MASGLLAVLKRPHGAAALAVVIMFLLSTGGCSILGPSEASYPTTRTRANRGPGINKPSTAEPESVFGPGGLSIGGPAAPPDDGSGGGPGAGGIGVNSFLWRASLDTVAFMPLVSADPFGGVIITDWYQPPAGAGERFKATAYILGRQLRADGVKVVIYRQVQQGGQWIDAPVNAAMAVIVRLGTGPQAGVAQTRLGSIG